MAQGLQGHQGKDEAVTISLLLVAAATAFSFNNVPWTEYYFLAGQVSFFFAVAALVLGVRRLGWAEFIFPILLASYVMFAATLTCGMGGGCSLRPLTGLVTVSFLVAVVALVVALIESNAGLERKFESAFIAAAWAIVILAIPDVLAIMSGDITSSWLESGFLRYSPQGTYDAPRLRGYTQEPSYLGMVIATLYPFVLLRLEARTTVSGLLLVLGVWVCLVFSLSKVGLGTCAFFTIVWLLGQRGKMWRSILLAGALSAILLAVMDFEALLDSNRHYIAQWEDDGIDISTFTRVGHMVAAFNVWLDHPFLGVGLGQSGYVLPDYYPTWLWQSPEAQHWASAAMQGGTPTFAFIPKLFAEIGLLGVLVLLIGVLPTARMTLRHWREDYYVRAFGSSFICFLISTFGVEGWQYLPGWIVFGVLMGLSRRNAGSVCVAPGRASS